MRIFFADPHAPWQRGANENTNGLLRQHFPKGTSLTAQTQLDPDTVTASLNDRPRKTLDNATPDEQFTKFLAELQWKGTLIPVVFNTERESAVPKLYSDTSVDHLVGKHEHPLAAR